MVVGDFELRRSWILGAPVNSYAVASSPVTLSGTATDDVAVDHVRVEIYDRVHDAVVE